MFYSISGKLVAKKPQFAAIETNGIGFKIFASPKTLQKLPKIGFEVRFFCHTNIRQDGAELYGFLEEKELEVFELLLSINGVGPKAGLKILEITNIDSLLSAIKQGRSDLLTKAAGIGSKKAQRIVLELQDKIKKQTSDEEITLLEADMDIEKALKNLGYKQKEISEAIKKIPPKTKSVEERLKAALKIIAIFIFTLSIFTFTFFSSNSAFAANGNELRESIDKRNQELQKINSQIQEVQQNLEETKQEGKTLKKELNKVDNQANQIQLGIKSSEVLIEKLGLETESLTGEISGIEEKIKDKRQSIAEIIRKIQERNNQGILFLLLRHKSLVDSAFEMQSLSDLNTSLTNEINEMRVLRGDLSEKKDESIQTKQKKEVEYVNLKYKKQIVDEVKKEKQSLLEQTKNQEKNYQKQLEELEKQQLAISDEISDLEDELRRAFDPSVLPIKRPGVFEWPIKLKKDGGVGRITQHQGEVSRLYKGRPHNGLDIGAPIGTPVYAADDGIIEAVDNNDRSYYRKYQYGKYVFIKHNNNMSTLYAHLSKQVVKEGEAVKRGDLIGYSGNTGYSTGPHLHFGVYWAPSITFKAVSPAAGLVPIGVVIDPEDYL